MSKAANNPPINPKYHPTRPTRHSIEGLNNYHFGSFQKPGPYTRPQNGRGPWYKDSLKMDPPINGDSHIIMPVFGPWRQPPGALLQKAYRLWGIRAVYASLQNLACCS